MKLLIAFAIMAIAIFVAVLCWAILGAWKDFCKDTEFVIDLEKFKSLYYLAPSKYRLSDTSIVYNHCFTVYKIALSFRDYLKYLSWIDQVKKEKSDLMSMKRKREYLQCAQDDLDKYKKSAKEEIESMQRSIKSPCIFHPFAHSAAAKKRMLILSNRDTKKADITEPASE